MARHLSNSFSSPEIGNQLTSVVTWLPISSPELGPEGGLFEAGEGVSGPDKVGVSTRSAATAFAFEHDMINRTA